MKDLDAIAEYVYSLTASHGYEVTELIILDDKESVTIVIAAPISAI